MKHIHTQIREIHPDEYDLLREFLYQALYLPEGAEPPPRPVIGLPELQVYIAGPGTQPGNHCLVAETEGTVAGATIGISGHPFLFREKTRRYACMSGRDFRFWRKRAQNI